MLKRSIILLILSLPPVSNLAIAADPVYPPSDYIATISFDMSTLRNVTPGNGESAPESDNWTITWADDDNQYTSFGDGKGFSTFNSTRASMGVARIEGERDNYSAFDTFKTGSNSGGWGGKSLGIISIGPKLYLFRNGTGSNDGAFDQTELYESADHGNSFSFTGGEMGTFRLREWCWLLLADVLAIWQSLLGS